MTDEFKIFKEVSNKELLEMYKDIIGSKELGLRPRTLDPYAQVLKETCHFEMLSRATDFVIELFYEEVAMRYFENLTERDLLSKEG